MAPRKNLKTPDGRHVQFGDRDTVTMPEGFTAPDESETESQWFGRMMVNPGDGGFGAASIEADPND